MRRGTDAGARHGVRRVTARSGEIGRDRAQQREAREGNPHRAAEAGGGRVGQRRVEGGGVVVGDERQAEVGDEDEGLGREIMEIMGDDGR